MGDDCSPKTIVQFEKIVDSNEAVRIEELDKISSVLDDSPNVTIIASEARPCIYKKVWERDEFYNPNRDGNGPPVFEKKFTYEQLNAMKRQVCDLKEKYSVPPLQELPLAENLVEILDEYCLQITDEYDKYFITNYNIDGNDGIDRNAGNDGISDNNGNGNSIPPIS